MGAYGHFFFYQRATLCGVSPISNRVPFLKRGQYKRNETQSIWIIGEYYVINHPDKAYRACRGSIRRHLKKGLVQRLLPDPRLRRTCTIFFSLQASNVIKRIKYLKCLILTISHLFFTIINIQARQR